MNKCAFPEEITTMLPEHRFGVLATYGGEYPYTSLISLAFSNDFRYLIFPTLRETRKFTNMSHETRVSVLLDNRSSEKCPEKLYAVTILGLASETDPAMNAVFKELFLQRHPQLDEFLALPQTALIQIILKKVILVEELQKIREFDCSSPAL
jgi:nitroimidazol reductase NimA-like FMN-containing flavoprotein (pyridoxamine 5'-phosphate oxidase superfamily)